MKINQFSAAVATTLCIPAVMFASDHPGDLRIWGTHDTPRAETAAAGGEYAGKPGIEDYATPSQTTGT